MLLTLRPEQISRCLWRIVLVLTAAHVLGQIARWGFGYDSVLGLVPLFDLNEEVNIPTFYAALSLTLCAVLMAVNARVQSRRKASGVLHWAGLSVVFLFLALDEFASLHERLSDPVRSSLDVGGVLTSAWVIPYGIAGLLLLGTYIPFLMTLPVRTRMLLMSGGVTFVLGAIGMEMAAGPAKEAAAGSPSLAITLFTTLEELLEMAGVVICIHGLTTHLVRETGCLHVRLGVATEGVVDEAETASVGHRSPRVVDDLFHPARRAPQ